MRPDFAGRMALTAAVACLVAVGVTLGALVMPAVRARMGLAPVPRPAYAVGDRIDVPASIYEGSSYTVILFARSSCGVCQQIKPWLAGLTASLQRQPSVQVVMVASGGRASDEVSYAADVGVSRQRVFQLAAGPHKLRSVPVLVLVDRGGVVRYSQEGMPRANRDQVVGTMTSLILPR
jgi:hypothetical protein